MISIFSAHVTDVGVIFAGLVGISTFHQYTIFGHANASYTGVCSAESACPSAPWVFLFTPPPVVGFKNSQEEKWLAG